MSTAFAGHMLERAVWAAESFATYDADSVGRIAQAVADAAYEASGHYAEWAVRETGMGVVADKIRKNQACSRGILEFYRGQDFVSPRVDELDKIVEIPRPAGVVLALTPTTNPVSSVYFKVLIAMLTRNAIVVAPHPRAKLSCADAAHMLSAAAVEAGAPDGIIQVVDEPTIPLMEALMSDDRTDVIVATGGSSVVRAAYSSGNPALGVGPGNVPVFVDATADVRLAAQRIVDSKAFDNSLLCTNESVLIAEDAVADGLMREMQRVGAHFLDVDDVNRLREYMFPEGHLNTDVVGKDAVWIADKIGLRLTAKTRLLVAPFDVVRSEEVLAHEKLSPVIGMVRVPDADRGVRAARAVVRIAGAGHSAAIHSENSHTIMNYAALVPVLRISVNVGNSTGSAGLDTNLAPSMTIGTGFAGRSSIGDNLEPKHLLNWARVAYNSDESVRMANLSGVEIWQVPAGAVPIYPIASNATPRSGVAVPKSVPRTIRADSPVRGSSTDADRLRAELRRIVVEELSQLNKR